MTKFAVHAPAIPRILPPLPTQPDQPRLPGADASSRIDELSRRAVAGDHAALSDLHAALTPGLNRHFARKLSGVRDSDALADELAQNTWVLLWSLLQAGKYDPTRARLTTFIYAVSHIAWLRFMRERQRDARRAAQMPEIDALDLAAGDDPAASVQLAGELQMVRDALAGAVQGFGPADQELLRAIALGQTDRELASQLGVSPSTAHQRKRGILDRLAHWLGASPPPPRGPVPKRTPD
jgi:RNA polymerase sigma factor (sigma-70 family)